MEKFSTLFKSYENVYAQGAPVIICARALIKDNESGKVFVQLKFKNITEKVISAVKVNIEGFDAFGNKTDYIEGYQYLELSAKRNDEFGNRKLVPFQNINSRSFKVKCTEVLYADGTSFVCDDSEDWVIIPEQASLESKLGAELAAQYRRDTFEKAVFAPDSAKDIWRCACGAINKNSEGACSVCGNRWMEQYMALDTAVLAVNLEEFRFAEHERAEAARFAAMRKAEEDRIAAEARKKKNKKIAMIAIPILAVLAAILIFVYVTWLKPLMEYNDAVELMEFGYYNQAIDAFERMEGYKDSADLITECEYRIAENLFSSEKYEEAIAAFTALADYKDSKTKIDDCRYQMAVELMEDEKFEEAIAAFEKIINHSDSKAKIEECKTGILEQKYRKALELFNNAKFDEATAAFEEIIDYKDSAEQIENIKKEIVYREAVSLYNDQKYKKALEKFNEIKGYKDVDRKIELCNSKIKANSSSGGSGSNSGSGFNNKDSIRSGFNVRITNKSGNRVTCVLTCNHCGSKMTVKADYGSKYNAKCSLCGNYQRVTLK